MWCDVALVMCDNVSETLYITLHNVECVMYRCGYGYLCRRLCGCGVPTCSGMGLLFVPICADFHYVHEPDSGRAGGGVRTSFRTFTCVHASLCVHLCDHVCWAFRAVRCLNTLRMYVRM